MEQDKPLVKVVKAWAHGGAYVLVPSALIGKTVKIIPVKEAQA